MIAFEALVMVEHPKMPQRRLDLARDMANTLLRDLRQIV